MANDWYNDPPEYDEGPTCPECGGYADELTSNKHCGRYKCEDCGHQWILRFGEDPGPEERPLPDDYAFEPECPELCPHGREWHECNACMAIGDFLADCAREARHFR